MKLLDLFESKASQAAAREEALYQLGLQAYDNLKNHRPISDEEINKAVLQAFKNVAGKKKRSFSDYDNIIDSLADFREMMGYLKRSGWNNPEIEAAIKKSLTE